MRSMLFALSKRAKISQTGFPGFRQECTPLGRPSTLTAVYNYTHVLGGTKCFELVWDSFCRRNRSTTTMEGWRLIAELTTRVATAGENMGDLKEVF